MTTTQKTLAGLRASSDWCEAFEYATKPQPCLGYDGSTAGASIDDVADVVALSDGENDGADWVGVFVLADGRYLFLAAGCDYTGWDCQAGGSAWVAADLEGLVQYGLTSEARERLALNDSKRVAVVAALVGVTSPAEALEVLHTRGLWPWATGDDDAPRWWCARCYGGSVRGEEVERIDEDGQAHIEGVECYLCDGFGCATTPPDIAALVTVASLGVTTLATVAALAGEVHPGAEIVWRVMPRWALREHHANRHRETRGSLIGGDILADAFTNTLLGASVTMLGSWSETCPYGDERVVAAWPALSALYALGVHPLACERNRVVIGVEAVS